MREHLVDVDRVHEHLRALGNVGLAALPFVGLRHDGYVEARQLAGQPDVLPAPPDRKRKLLVGDDHLFRQPLLVEDDLRDGGRLQRGQGEFDHVVGPGNDVDPLALQLVHDRLDPGSPHPDARPHGVDAALVGKDRDLGPRSGVSRHAADFDQAVVDFRDFHPEQFDHEFRRDPGQENLRPALLAPHIGYIGAQALAVAVALSPDFLVAPEHGLASREVEHDVPELFPLHGAYDDRADSILEFLVLALALGVAHLLQNHLLGGLGGDAPHLKRRKLVDELVADFGIRLLGCRILPGDFLKLVLDFIDDLPNARQREVARAAVKVRTDVEFRSVTHLGGFRHGFLHRFNHDLAFDHLLLRDRFRDPEEFQPVGACNVHRTSFIYAVCSFRRAASLGPRRVHLAKGGLRSTGNRTAIRSCLREFPARFRFRRRL